MPDIQHVGQVKQKPGRDHRIKSNPKEQSDGTAGESSMLEPFNYPTFFHNVLRRTQCQTRI